MGRLDSMSVISRTRTQSFQLFLVWFHHLFFFHPPTSCLYRHAKHQTQARGRSIGQAKEKASSPAAVNKAEATPKEAAGRASQECGIGKQQRR